MGGKPCSIADFSASCSFLDELAVVSADLDTDADEVVGLCKDTDADAEDVEADLESYSEVYDADAEVDLESKDVDSEDGAG